ncbi:hypothetical protein F2P56_031499 [Juglans regia]|uniref:Bifunctional inhibitor/plant lipid transfer protein/seed storage helical domain-containing protein n=1 Tax=Juglans regia TaxID=51240 RepID=A0A833WW89_JUGRE|nr:hypothetical protein F2P56_031499 [Juglans regia]
MFMISNQTRARMGLHRATARLPFILVLLSVMLSYMVADPAKDREECQQQLVGMATCLPYVDGEATAPTPDCCNGLKQVLKNNKKCLCVIIRDRNDPDLGLQINVTLALGLPSICRAPANVSNCPVGGRSVSGRTEETSGQDKNDGCCSRKKKWFGQDIVARGFLIWCFISSNLFI